MSSSPIWPGPMSATASALATNQAVAWSKAGRSAPAVARASAVSSVSVADGVPPGPVTCPSLSWAASHPAA